ncbi:MAG: GNAT family N-acetyltransferase [Chloroflexales bacterium]|nr:GNAT family N-acetyltransferase [Chloroflexales bacterium]
MALLFQRATPNDASAIVQLLALVWPHQPANPDQVATALAPPGHATYLATCQDQAVGLVSGFPTVSVAGEIRWEIDLLAVHPAYRGQQIGRRLVQCSTAAGRAAQARVARALIASDNHASQRTIAMVGYHMQPEEMTLYVTAPHRSAHPATGAPIHLIPVQTLTYSGAWLEGAVTTEAVQEACARQAAHGWSTLGTLVPQQQVQFHGIVQHSGFACIGRYHWWIKPYELRDDPAATPGCHHGRPAT